MNTIEIRDLHKHFGKVRAVNGLDLDIAPGEIVAFLGPNGAGKTTTIDMILGLTTPTTGTVKVLGASPRNAIHARRIGAVLQTGGLLNSLTVQETVLSIASLQGTTQRVGEVMERAHLAEIARRKVAKCSGGEQQRVKFALALLGDPELLILDEPTSGMDAPTRREFWAQMRHEAEAGRTIVFATHYLEEAQDFAQRIVLIGLGKLLADGPVTQIRAMVSGRQIEASINHLDQERLAQLWSQPSVRDIETNGDRVTITTTDSDSLAQYLLGIGASDLLISAPSLESAFLDLTKDNR